MKKLFIALFFVVTLCSCATVEPNLYNWCTFQGNKTYCHTDRYYEYYKTQTPESYARLYITYSNIIAKPGGARAVPPPGICAEFGYMLLDPELSSILINYYSNPENFPKKIRKEMENTDWSQTFAPEVLRAKGLEMFQKEIELYPESVIFIEPFIKRLSQQ